MASAQAATHLEGLFHAASIDLQVPELSRIPPQPSHDLAEWWDTVRRSPPRSVAFLGQSSTSLTLLVIPD